VWFNICGFACLEFGICLGLVGLVCCSRGENVVLFIVVFACCCLFAIGFLIDWGRLFSFLV